MKVELVPIESASGGFQFDLGAAPLTLGRSQDADLPVLDRWVSRRHCQLFIQEGELIVRDLGSKHGTLVNNRPVVEKVLRPGDKLSLGLTSFRATFVSSDAASNSADDSASTNLSASPLQNKHLRGDIRLGLSAK